MNTSKWCRSLAEALEKLNINESNISNYEDSDLSVIDQSFETIENSNNNTKPQESNDGGSLDLPCRMPQTAGDTASSDDTDPESDVIVVVDSLSHSEADLRCLLIDHSNSESNSESEVELWDLDSCTISETSSEGIINGSTSETSIMDNRLRTPSKRKHECHSESNELQSEISPIKCTPEKINKSPLVAVTRSGRSVRARFDHKFDYSSEEYSSILDESHDPNIGDSSKIDSDSPWDVANESAEDDIDYKDEEDDDEDEDEDDDDDEATRRIARRHTSIHLKIESNAIIYLDLRQHVAIVSNEPTSDAALVENDGDLKTQLQKFLGLVPARRRLYNPMDNFELEDNCMNDDENEQPIQRSRLFAGTNDNALSKAKLQPALQRESVEQPSQQNSRLKTLPAEMTSDMQMLLINEKVQRINAMCYESQTPQHIKEPIDLDCLPSEEERVHICKQHKEIIKMLEPNEEVYSFVNSLSFDTPLNMCHPLAVDYCNSDLRTCKTPLARTLFNLLNHTIFHCGLRLSIKWNNCMSSSVVHCFEAGGKRMSRIFLSTLIKHPSDLVKPLLHEMCHAAAFVYHGEVGHGDNCRKWAYRAKSLMPELPQIDDCDDCYRYTCLLCRGQSFGICNFKDVEQQLRCHYCQFEVKVEPYSVDNIQFLSITNQQETPYKKFVRDNYLKIPQSSHSSKMLSINAQYMKQTEKHPL